MKYNKPFPELRNFLFIQMPAPTDFLYWHIHCCYPEFFKVKLLLNILKLVQCGISIKLY